MRQIGSTVGFLLIVFWSSSTSWAQETWIEPRLGFSAPYQLEPDAQVSDSAMLLGGTVYFYPGFGFGLDSTFGLRGENAIRLELGPHLRLFPSRSLNPEVAFGGTIQVRPDQDGGIFGRAGVSWDLSRALGLWYMRVGLQSGMSLLLAEPRKLEWDVVRILISFPF